MAAFFSLVSLRVLCMGGRKGVFGFGIGIGMLIGFWECVLWREWFGL